MITRTLDGSNVCEALEVRRETVPNSREAVFALKA
jgi:hypothetical protein